LAIVEMKEVLVWGTGGRAAVGEAPSEIPSSIRERAPVAIALPRLQYSELDISCLCCGVAFAQAACAALLSSFCTVESLGAITWEGVRSIMGSTQPVLFSAATSVGAYLRKLGQGKVSMGSAMQQ